MDQESIETLSKNQSSLNSFILLGFSDLPQLHYPLLVSFYLLYILTVTGNLLIIALVIFNTSLQSPMYFFLCNLAFLDVCYTSVTLPTLIFMHSKKDKTIYFIPCILQQYFYISFVVSEYFLLAAMAYDRYVAICKPLHYSVIMSRNICILLAKGCWLIGFINSWVPVSFSSHFNFCRSRIINHFFCDLTALLKLACHKVSDVQAVIFTESIILGLLPFLFTLTSYVKIISTIFSINSESGKCKAFSTCASHITVVILFYGTMIGVYMRPTSLYRPSQDKFFALLYTAVIPLLNPIIYTLRNCDVKVVFKKSLKRCVQRRYKGQYSHKIFVYNTLQCH
ncbi:olfactory receptor 1L4-like [Rhinophrynus dorsalis]